jgi:glycosyltransferase involved in cell wall biosynthesis
MKILLAHNYYQQPGGEDPCAAAEIAMLEARGHEVVPYYLHNDAIDGMSRLDVASRTIWSRSAYREVRELIRAERPQIAHFHNTFPLISPAAYYAARAENVPVVQTLHNFRLLCPGANFFRDGQVCEDCLGRVVPWPALIHRCYRGSGPATATLVAMLAVHRAMKTWREAVDVYVALSAFCREKFIAGGLSGERIAVKPNFVDPDPGAGAGSGGYAVFAGRLSPEKGVAMLLSAWTRLPGRLKLKIIGDGPLAPMVRDAAAHSPQVEWLGARGPAETLAVVGEATCLVMPSICYETFGRTIIEAYAKGTPVLASRLGSRAELVDEGRTGWLFEAGNAEDLAAQVRRFPDDPAELRRMRQAARAEYEQKYAAESNYRVLLAIYEKALGGKSATRRLGYAPPTPQARPLRGATGPDVVSGAGGENCQVKL